MIQIHRIKCGNANCYVLDENGNAIVVDTGKTRNRKEIEQKIKQKTSGLMVKLIVLTHAHFDHCQNADCFSKQFQAPIAMHRNDVGLIRDQMKETLSAKSIPGKIVLGASVASFKKVAMDFAPAVFLKDKDCLDRYGISARVIGLPGHTKVP